jgi:hypothetical protein
MTETPEEQKRITPAEGFPVTSLADTQVERGEVTTLMMRQRQREHSERFRKLGGMAYPRRVAEAYGRDLARAAAATDEQVAATVAAWERSQGLAVRDWAAVGRARAEELSEDDPGEA